MFLLLPLDSLLLQAASAHAPRPLRLRQHALQNFIYDLRVGLPARFLHYLAHEKFEYAVASCAVISAAFFPVSNIVANTFLPLAAVISPRSMIESNSASAAGATRQSEISLPASFNRRSSSTEIQLAAARAGAPARATASK